MRLHHRKVVLTMVKATWSSAYFLRCAMVHQLISLPSIGPCPLFQKGWEPRPYTVRGGDIVIVKSLSYQLTRSQIQNGSGLHDIFILTWVNVVTIA